MAVAFYIPDQATLLRKAQQQEQQILRLRESHWRFLASVVLDALKQYMEPTPNTLRKGGRARKCGKWHGKTSQ